MILDISVHLDYGVPEPMELILQIHAAQDAEQKVLAETLQIGALDHARHHSAEDGVGARSLIRTNGDFACHYSAKVAIDRPAPNIATLPYTPVHQLPGDVVRYLLPSRYCLTDELQNFVEAEFTDTSGGARIAMIRDWIAGTFHYVPGSSNAQTTAMDSFVQRQGVCRDFAHVLIMLARASAIPARFVSVYAPKVQPLDFHAVAEVYLDGNWHLVDPTHMSNPSDTVRIGVGLDAAEVSFLTSFGQIEFRQQTVSVVVAQSDT